MRRRHVFSAAVLTAGLVLAGCSSDPQASPTSSVQVSDQHNAADIAFVQGMIPHHGQALAMARLAPERTGSDAVRDLAQRIEAAQAPEIEAMTGWLQAWDAPVPDSGTDGGGGHEAHGMDADAHAGSGMLDTDQMAALEAAEGQAWDELFLAGMIEHHRGAVAMAETELAQGLSPEALELAQAVIEGQTGEIEEMEALLAGVTPPEAVSVPQEAGHVHGVGRNPADGLLYIGTHNGLFALSDDSIQKVGAAGIDLMGFAVAGPDHFLASGHPGPGDDLPDPVGLLESTDGGTTWSPVSLTGESDFHALTAGDGGSTVYAFDRALRVSDDGGRTWTPGEPGLLPAAVAASPGTPSTVLATTQEGVRLSTDGGATFTLVDDAPVLVFLAWAGDTQVWGVDPVGVLHASSDGGRAWERLGATGAPPQAITADAQGVTVVTATRILVSEDGRSFRTLATMH